MTTIEDSIKPTFQAPISERFVVWLRNLWHWRTKWAVNHLSKQLQRDSGFRQSWHANIAMPIYDATTPKCTCTHELKVGAVLHYSGCPMIHGKRYDYTAGMPIEQANHIADKIMAHIFNA